MQSKCSPPSYDNDLPACSMISSCISVQLEFEKGRREQEATIDSVIPLAVELILEGGWRKVVSWRHSPFFTHLWGAPHMVCEEQFCSKGLPSHRAEQISWNWITRKTEKLSRSRYYHSDCFRSFVWLTTKILQLSSVALMPHLAVIPAVMYKRP